MKNQIAAEEFFKEYNQLEVGTSTAKWMRQNFIITRRQKPVDWSKVKPGTKILVWDTSAKAEACQGIFIGMTPDQRFIVTHAIDTSASVRAWRYAWLIDECPCDDIKAVHRCACGREITR